MADHLLNVALILGCYLLGAIPFGYILVRVFRGMDIRALGSGNVGATNASRALGRWGGIACYVLDFAKGFGPLTAVTGAAEILAPADPWRPGLLAIACGTAAIIGHVFPVYLGFRGGKGVAVSSGVMMALAPLATFCAGGVFAGALLATRYVSLSSMAGAFALPIALAALEPEARGGERTAMLGFTALMAVLVAALHRANIGRLLRGEEPKVFRKKEPRA